MLKWLKGALGAARPAASPATDSPSAREAAAQQRRGNALLDEGKPAEALRCYEAAARLAPSAAAFVNTGFALKELGRAAEARAALEQALALDAGQFDAAYLLGVLALSAGDAAAAAVRLRQAHALEPRDAMALHALCNACVLAGDAGGARQAAQAGIAAHPGDADFRFLLGNVLMGEGRHGEAEAGFRAALALRPDHAQARHNLGLAVQAAGRLQEAAACFRAALALQPLFPQALGSLATVLTEQGLPLEAIACCEQAIAIDPLDAEAHNNLGNALLALGRHEAAAASYSRAIELRDGHAQAHNNLGLALLGMNALEPAAQAVRRALALEPGYARGHNNLGNVLQRQNLMADAVASYARALELQPDFVQAHSNLAVALQAQGHHEAAVASWRQALALQPDYLEAWSNMLYVLSFAAGWGPRDYLREARAFGAAAAARARPFDHWPLATLAPGEPLRVGFVSGDLREHPVGFFLENVLAHIDPSRLTLLAYPTQAEEDGLTARIRPRFAAWRPLMGLADAQAAAGIRADGVHLLVDLAGHTAHNRLPLFAWRAAPVQLSWLGFFASTGMPGIDYLIADRTGVPPAHEADFSEAVRYLPDTRLCFSPPAGGEGIEPNGLPARRNGFVTFGCFQNMTKLNDAVLALWGRVFAALPQARLRLQSKQMRDGALRELLLSRLAAHGIAPERVHLAGPSSRRLYFAAHHEVDIMLDSFPYGGGTTTCESLWMGVPTLTLAGQTLLSRQGASLLSCVGLADWIAEDADGYVARAEAHAGALEALELLRAGLRAQALASPLFDGRRFAGRLEDLLHALWREKAGGSASADR